MSRPLQWRCAPPLQGPLAVGPGPAQRHLDPLSSQRTLLPQRTGVCPTAAAARDQAHDRLASSCSASTSGRCAATAHPCRERSRRHVVARCSKQLTFRQRPQHTVHSRHPGSDGDPDGQLALLVSSPTSHAASNGQSNGHHHPEVALLTGHEPGLSHGPSVIQQIEASCDEEQLDLLLHSAHLRLGPAQLSAALAHLATLVTQRQQDGAAAKDEAKPAHASRVAELATAGLLRCSEPLAPQHLSSIAASLASLRCYPLPLLLRLVQGAAEQRSAFTPPQAAQLLWALGRLHHHCKLEMDPQLVPSLLTWRPSSQGQEERAAAISALYGCALLRRAPPGPWLEAFLSQVPSSSTAPLSAQVSQGQMSKVLWCLAVLGCDPGRPWLERALERMSGRLTLSSGCEAASALWALASMRHAPSAVWMGHYLWQVQRMFNRCSASQLQLIAWSLARLQYRPEANWVRQFLTHLVSRLRGNAALGRARARSREPDAAGVRAQSAAVALWALAKLQAQPDSRLLRKVSAAMQPLLPACAPCDLARLAWSLQRLSFLPDAQWMAEAQLEMHARMQRLDLTTVIVLLSALKSFSHVSASAARLGKQNLVDGQLVSLLCMRLESLSCGRSAALSLRSCLTLLLTLGKLQAPISRELHGYLLQQASSHLEDMPLGKLPMVCWSLCMLACGNGDSRQLRAHSQQRLLPRIERLVQGHLASPACGTKDLLQLAQGFAAVSYRPGDAWLQRHEASAARLARQGHVRPSVASMLLQCYGRLSHEPRGLTAVLRSSSMQAMQAMLEAMQGAGEPGEPAAGEPAAALLQSASELVHYLSGFGAAAFHPGGEWLQRHEACAAALARRGAVRSRAAAALAQGYARLRYDARALRGQLQATAGVRIGGVCFTTREKACAYFAELLSRASPDEPLDRDSKMLMALLRHHPAAAEKIGVGVSGFQVQLINDGAARAFFLMRQDGSSERFSYVKCCTAAFWLAAQPGAEGGFPAPQPQPPRR